MKYLLDTCVLSEAFKKNPDKHVLEWIDSREENRLYLSVLTLAEIEKGIIKCQEPVRQEKLRTWLESDLMERFKHRILPIDLGVAIAWGRIQAESEKKGTPMPVIDGLIAVTGLVNDCTVVTRNTGDMRMSQVQLYNPWEDTAPFCGVN
ncbi:type II toxin-antitoxin system VapC family toxin [Endozoicomonas sp. 4G]|uniref:type II toxin-antitoxin system VapC family toxin n=1 Tax=Endozoicomonas sp. 4G TaxID=2872754 RepID=UPI002078D8D0|nr:type II toxin-antitoxin system VapC family toxin [Endozoicomonas sp. 4G]